MTVIDARHRVPDRALHGQGRLAAGPAAAGDRGAHAAVGVATWSRRTPGAACSRAERPDRVARSTRSGSTSPGYGLTATVVTLAYLWLPFMILPIYAGLERLPDSLLEASADLGAAPGTTLRRVVLPMLFPAIVAGSIFTFSLTLGDYIAVQIVGGANQMLGNVVYDNVLTRQQPAVRRRGGDDPGRDHARLPGRRPPHRRAGEPVTLSPRPASRAAALAPCWRCCSSTRRWRWWCSTRSTPPDLRVAADRASPLEWWRRPWTVTGRARRRLVSRAGGAARHR